MSKYKISYSYIFNRYPKFGNRDFYRAKDKEELINIIRNLCLKYSYVRIKFCNFNQKILFLERENKMLKKRLKHVLLKYNYSHHFKNIDKIIKNDKTKVNQLKASSTLKSK